MQKKSLLMIISAVTLLVLFWFVIDIRINREFHVRRLINEQIHQLLSGNCKDIDGAYRGLCLYNRKKTRMSSVEIGEISFRDGIAFVQLIVGRQGTNTTYFLTLKKNGLFVDQWRVIRFY